MGVQERKERDFKRREGEILDAALGLFSRDDWQAVTIDEIAQAAEIGKGTIYKHFPSKEDIYARLAAEFGRKLLARVRDLDPGTGILDRFRAMIRLVWEQHLNHREYHRLVLYCERDDFRRLISEESRQLLLAADAEWLELLSGIVQEGIAEGLFPGDKPLELILFGPHSALWGAIHLTMSGCFGAAAASANPDAFLSEITDYIITGMTNRAPLAPGRAQLSLRGLGAEGK